MWDCGNFVMKPVEEETIRNFPLSMSNSLLCSVSGPPSDCPYISFLLLLISVLMLTPVEIVFFLTMCHDAGVQRYRWVWRHQQWRLCGELCLYEHPRECKHRFTYIAGCTLWDYIAFWHNISCSWSTVWRIRPLQVLGACLSFLAEQWEYKLTTRNVWSHRKKVLSNRPYEDI